MAYLAGLLQGLEVMLVEILAWGLARRPRHHGRSYHCVQRSFIGDNDAVDSQLGSPEQPGCLCFTPV